MINKVEKKYFNFNNSGITKVVMTITFLSVNIYSSVKYFDKNEINITTEQVVRNNQVKESL
jgi:hypothetical protein